MNEINPYELIFADMQKLGPGSDEDTLHVLESLPTDRFGTIVDAGCGTGRQSLTIARRLNSSYRCTTLVLRNQDTRKSEQPYGRL